MKNEGFKEIDGFSEKDDLVLFYENESSSPVLIRRDDIPRAVAISSEDAIVTDLLDQFICSTFGCFLNRLAPGYDWVREELIMLQMAGEEDESSVEFANLD